MKRIDRLLAAFTAALIWSHAALAQQPASKPDNAAAKPSAASGVLGLLPSDAVTEHVLPGADGLAYVATAGTLSLFDGDGDKSAAIFYTSYVAKDRKPGRPLTFAFNGGPGAGSAFLHLGLVGPKILDFGPSERDGVNARLIDNPQSWIAFTDLVMIDPVGTGWSRPAKPGGAQGFYGVSQDAQVIAKTIALYVARNSRSESPKFLLGESYGGLRALKVAGALQESQGIATTGILMLSPLIEAPLQFGATRFALGAALQLPSLAAAQLERTNRLSPANIEAAERFALQDYLPMLAGLPPQEDAAEAFYRRVAEMTGLSLETVRKTRGFLRDAFTKHLRESEQAVVSSYDVNTVAPDPFPESDSSRGDDPVLDGFARNYGGAFVGYARDQLGFKTDMTYELLASDINGKWDWGRGGRSQVSGSDDMRQLLSVNPGFRIMVAHGYSDLVTPYGVNKYVVDHLPDPLRSRVVFKVYRGGHMFYTRQASRADMTSDAWAFYKATLSAVAGD